MRSSHFSLVSFISHTQHAVNCKHSLCVTTMRSTNLHFTYLLIRLSRSASKVTFLLFRHEWRPVTCGRPPVPVRSGSSPRGSWFSPWGAAAGVHWPPTAACPQSPTDACCAPRSTSLSAAPSSHHHTHKLTSSNKSAGYTSCSSFNFSLCRAYQSPSHTHKLTSSNKSAGYTSCSSFNFSLCRA